MNHGKDTSLTQFPNLIARILLPALIALPLLVGLLTWAARELTALLPGSGSPIFGGLIAAAALCAALFALMVPAVRKAQARMREAARALADDQARLEGEVQARTLELSRRETEARRASDLLRSILDALPVWVLAKDRGGRTFLVNRLMAQDTGVPEPEWIGLTARELPHLDATQREAVAAEDARVMDAGRRGEVLRWTTRGRDGVARTIRTIRAPILGQGGEVDGVLSIAEDISTRVSAEERLQESESRFRQVLRLNKTGIFDHDHGQENIYWSPEQREIYSYGQDEPVTLQRFHAMVHPEDGEAIGAEVRRAHDPSGDGLFDVTHRIARRDGEVRWVETRSQTFFAGEGEARRAVRTVGAVQDITARKSIELALRESEERYRTLAESALHGIAIADPGGTFLYVNAAEARIFGFASSAEMVGTTFDERVHEDNLPLMRRYRAMRQRGEPAPPQYELKGKKKDGTEVWIEVSVAMVPWQGRKTFLGIHNDITARKATEEKLRANERLLRTIVDTLPVYISVKDSDFRYSLVNRRVADGFGVAPDAMVGKRVEDYAPVTETNAERLRWVQQHDSDVLRTGIAVDWTDILTERQAGRLRRERHTKLPLRDESGEITGVLSVAEDITDRVRAEEALRMSEAQLASVFNTTRDLLVLTKVEADGRFTYEAVNPAYLDFVRRVLPGESRDVLGRDRAEVFREWGLPAEIVERELPAYRSVVESRTSAHHEFTAFVPGSGGEAVSLAVSIEPILNERGECTHILWSGHDITELKRAERILRDVNAELEHRVAERTQALTESESRYRAVVENSLQGIAVIQDGRVAFANQAEAAIFGFEGPGRMAGIESASLIAKRDRDFIIERARVREPETTFPEAYQFTGLKQDGTEVAIESRTQRLQWQGRPAVIVAHLDVTGRRAAEEALRASETRYRELIERSPGGMFVHHNHRPAYANPAFAAMLGYGDPAEILELSSNLELFHPEERGRLAVYHEARKRGDSAPDQYEVRMLKRSGETVWVSLSVRQLVWEGRTANMDIAWDITARRRAEDELRASEARYRDLIERSPQGIVIQRNFELIFANPAFANMMEFDGPDDVLALRDIMALVHPDERERMLAYQSARDRGAPVPAHYEMRLVNRRGAAVWVETQVRRIPWEGAESTLAIVLDITKRKETEIALRRSEERYRVVVERSLQGVLVTGTEGTIYFANEAAARLYGFANPHDMAGFDANKLIAAENLELVRERRRKLAAGEHLPTAIVQGRRIDGESVWVMANAEAIEWDGRDAMLATVIDITEQHEAAQALRGSEERYRMLAEGSMQGILISRGNQILYANPAEARMLGYDSPAAMVGLPADVLLSEDSIPIAEERRAKVLAGEPVPRARIRARKRNGEDVWLDANVNAVAWDGEPALMGLHVDVTEQHRAQEALRESEARYRTIVDNSLQGIVTIRPDGTILSANARAAALHGFATGDEMRGLRMDAFISAESLPQFLLRREKRMRGEQVDPYFEYEGTRKDGVPIWIGLIGVPVEWEGKPALMGMFIDLTDRRRVEKELRESEARLKAIMTHAPALITLRDADCRFLMVNPYFEKVLNLKNEEIAGKLPSDVLDPRLSPTVERRLRDVLETGKTATYVEATPSKAVKWIYMTRFPIFGDNERVVGVGGIGIDITAQMEFEERLRESEARYRSIVDTANEGIWAIDRQGNTTFANARMAVMLGCDLERLRSSSALEFIAPKDHAMARENFEAYARGAPQIVEQRFVRQDGTPLWVLFSGTPIRGADGEPVGTLGMLTDITARKQAEAELKQAQQDVLRNEKLATVGQLTATVSHELRNPLGTIRASLYSLREQLKQYALPAVAKIVDRIGRNVDRCDNIVTDLLDFSRTRPLSPEVVNLCVWVKAELADLPLPDWLKLEFDVPAYPVTAMLDTDRFRRVLVNLVENSVQAMTEKRDGVPAREWSIKIRVNDRDGRVSLVVADNGMGIPEHVLPRVFDILFSTKTYGVGLGLPTVRQIVREHGGDVEISSEEGEGTEARITLPLAGGGASRQESQSRRAWQ